MTTSTNMALAFTIDKSVSVFFMTSFIHTGLRGIFNSGRPSSVSPFGKRMKGNGFPTLNKFYEPEPHFMHVTDWC